MIGVVVGSGFENRTRLLRSIAARYVLLGNTADTVSTVKDPFAFAETCARARVPHPEVRRDRPAAGVWLCKRDGGSGVAMSAPSTRRAGVRQGRYYQRRVAGEPVSAAFLAAGGRCRVLGLSRQWAAPTPSAPVPLRRRLASGRGHGTPRRRYRRGGRTVVSHTHLRGLNSADFLVREDGFDLLEVNPRPGATLDIFADREGVCSACTSTPARACCRMRRPPGRGPRRRRLSMHTRIFAFRWTLPGRPGRADRQPPGEPVPGGAPLCTVHAEAGDAATAESLVRDRAAEILARAEGANDPASHPWPERARLPSGGRAVCGRRALRVGVSRGESGECLIDAGANHRAVSRRACVSRRFAWAGWARCGSRPIPCCRAGRGRSRFRRRIR